MASRYDVENSAIFKDLQSIDIASSRNGHLGSNVSNSPVVAKYPHETLTSTLQRPEYCSPLGAEETSFERMFELRLGRISLEVEKYGSLGFGKEHLVLILSCVDAKLLLGLSRQSAKVS
ncbi:unnamed protein product [Cyclocybe aegerita]|uniref:Uncharacterized protein n=1 Tax=Cyclocybe aegerita TaxID=1973307 RepID=A0A8S0W1Q2_CYCAE|nr:unnamed protein product [Cyclocybe aegerita]